MRCKNETSRKNLTTTQSACRFSDMATTDHTSIARGRGSTVVASLSGPATDDKPRTANTAPGLSLRQEPMDDIGRILFLEQISGVPWDHELGRPGWFRTVQHSIKHNKRGNQTRNCMAIWSIHRWDVDKLATLPKPEAARRLWQRRNDPIQKRPKARPARPSSPGPSRLSPPRGGGRIASEKTATNQVGSPRRPISADLVCGDGEGLNRARR